MRLVPYFLAGIYFGVVATQSQIISWFRIQEMFRFESFHMYGVLGTGVAVALLGIQVVRRLELRALGGEPIHIPAKVLDKGHRYWIGGCCFGLGWGLIGACPGPIFALLGHGIWVMLAVLAAAMLGTWTYGALRSRLPH